MNATVDCPGYIFIVGKCCTDYLDGATLTILKLCTGLSKSSMYIENFFVSVYIIKWNSDVEITDIGYNIFGLGLVSLLWSNDHLRLAGMQNNSSRSSSSVLEDKGANADNLLNRA